MSFSERLRQLREERGLSQEELAEKLNINRSSITHYESGGKRIPRHERLNAIADFFGVSVDYLLGRSNSKEFTQDEKDFIEDVKVLTPQELKEKYRLTIDGKPATEEEIKAAIAYIRVLRSDSN